MTSPRADEADAEYLARTAHQVEAPERYEDWRAYAFSDAPELLDDQRESPSPSGSVPTV